ncbi:hypothetical protein OJF2_27470 [Aquisphaera giovannonii]|uniref:DUF1573 domain-containing protein n=1 Tax=Aquisphaera giovannonii TaxID=406548 RepID=A0A5B9W0P0_9BACT|nr:DUF1573 domain-containing protein [Aquisphaera giovannonii]QEH34212.1 hypothetical protein OJF2_27470 [Aquisphaera giovannonii]
MLRWVILSVAVVVLAAVGTLVSQFAGSSGADWDLPAVNRTKGPQPKLVIEGPLTHEFGDMATQKVSTHKWVVKNEGEGDLDLFLSGSSCMCTVAKLKDQNTKETVKPGASTEIEVEWKTKDQIGEFGKDVTLSTNDPSRPQFKLLIHGMVSAPVMVLPQPVEGVVSVGSIATDKPSEVSMAFFSPNRPDFKIGKITSSRPDLIEPKVIPLTEDEQKQLKTKGGYRLKMDIKPGIGQGDFREELIVETDHPDAPRMNLTLAGTATGPVSVVPTRLRMMSLDGKGDLRSQVQLLVRGGRTTTFTVAHKPEKVDVEIVPNDGPGAMGRYRMTVTAPPGLPPGIVDDAIILKTDLPGNTEVKVPVSIVVGAG